MNLATGKYGTLKKLACFGASEGDIVLVKPGTYSENINYKGKSITVASLFLTTGDPSYISQTIIDGGQNGPVVAFKTDEGPTAVLKGFTIQNGSGFNQNPTYDQTKGGGIYCSSSRPTLENLIVRENNAFWGGGIYCGHSGPMIINMVITNNTSTQGAGVCCWYGSPTLRSVVLASNFGSKGGGFYSGWDNPTLINTTVIRNTGSEKGGGVYCAFESSPSLLNCILWGNESPHGKEAYIGEHSFPILSYCDVEGGWNGPWTEAVEGDSPVDGGGNISADPIFIDPVNKDYHLSPHSPCVDAGDPNQDYTGQSDIDGEPRVLRGRVDIGADESDLRIPYIRTSAMRLEFSSPEAGSNPELQVLSIRNSGAGLLEWQIHSACDWLKVAPTSGQSSGGQVNEVIVSIDTQGLETGAYKCALVISDNSGTAIFKTVDVTIVIGGVRSVPGVYSTIQAAIDAANNGDIVLVEPGTYGENIDYKGKSITVASLFLTTGDPDYVLQTIIDGGQDGPVVAFRSHEGPGAVLKGFTIQNGSGFNENPTYNQTFGGGIYCRSSSPTLENLIVRENDAFWGGGISCSWSGCQPTLTNLLIANNTADQGAGVYCWYARPILTNVVISNNSGSKGGGFYSGYESPILINATIAGNSASEMGGAVHCANESSLSLLNCILWGNKGPFGKEIYIGPESSPIVSYCDIEDGWDGPGVEMAEGSSLVSGAGNINSDPMFLDSVNGDYHLLPLSPCINAGDPLRDYTGQRDTDRELRLLGGRVEIGADEVDFGTPLIEVSATNLRFKSPAPGLNPDPQVLTIHNRDVGTLEWEISYSGDWLEVCPGSGQTSGGQFSEIVVGVETDGLAGGAYHCTLTSFDKNSPDTSQTIAVNLVVNITRNVPDEYMTIQAAINAANDGDIITLASGTYTGEGNRDIDFKGKRITVRSANGPESCIIDCQGHGRGFYFHNSEDANSVLQGFTITNGDPHQTGDGGAISCESSSPTISNCILSANGADEGGGIYTSDSRSVLDQLIITDNNAYSGGGMCNVRSNLTITRCLISNNAANYGGGIRNYESSPTIADCVIATNTANDTGGGLFLKRSSSIIRNSKIDNNSGGRAAGIYNYESTPLVVNCTLTGNRADSRPGGAVHCFRSAPRLNNCTIVQNSADEGTGIYSTDDSSPILANCILWNGGDEIVNVEYSDVAVTYSDIQGGWEGLGNIDVEPEFVSPGYWTEALEDPNNPESEVEMVWTQGDYHLKSEGWRWDVGRQVWTWDSVTSRCIDAGNPGFELGEEALCVPSDPNGEFAENIRINMGAYGGTAEASIGPVDWSLTADLNNDGIVSFPDFAHQAGNVQEHETEPPGDLDRNGTFDVLDVALLVEDWLKSTTWGE